MVDFSDVRTEGVEPNTGGGSGLPLGEFLVRIEGTERKSTKTGHGALVLKYQVYGGPNDGETEEDWLNLWHSSADAVKFATIDLVSIQTAINTFSKNSDDFHGKWMMYKKTNGKKPETKDKIYKHYSPAPAGLVAQHAPNAPAIAARPAASHASVPAAAQSSNDKPAWA